MSVIYWSITFQETGSDSHYPVYEGKKDGKYWLGGQAKFMEPLLFASKKEADEAIKGVVRRILAETNDLKYRRITKGMWSKGKFVSRRVYLALL